MEEKRYQLSVNDQYEFVDESLPELDVLEVKDGHFHILFNHQAYRAEVIEALPEKKSFLIRINGNNYEVKLADQYDQLVKNLGLTTNITHKVKEVKAPMPGLVLEIMVEAGQEVKEGEPLFILEAMKMENVLKSPGDGVIAEVVVEKGAPVDKGTILVVMEQKTNIMKGNVPSRKKQQLPVGEPLYEYLSGHNRCPKLPLHYNDLTRYQTSVPLIDREGRDTLWETVYFQESDREEIFRGLREIYALLKTDGDDTVLEHLTIARVDFCTFGNTKPFRVRIINRINDNYDHFYLKKADASRVYGLELEDLLSPNRVIYLVDGDTLVEEHIAGIPGDVFLRDNLDESTFNQTRMAKEFVKFNERCFVRLLGDMRSYNYVVDITPDIEGNQYRLRAIDFDQQSYEGRKSFYLPQYFKENHPIIFLGIQLMEPKAVKQYQLEERSLIATRVKSSLEQVEALFDVMVKDKLSTPEKVAQLKEELAYHHRTNAFDRCTTMGEIVLANIRLLLQKDFKQSIVL